MNAPVMIVRLFHSCNLSGAVNSYLPFSINTTHAWAFHIDTTTLADGTYELVLESESEQCEAQVNLTEAAEDPNQNSGELKASYAQEGKPRSMTYYFQLYATYCFYILVHLSLQELIETLVVWS